MLDHTVSLVVKQTFGEAWLGSWNASAYGVSARCISSWQFCRNRHSRRITREPFAFCDVRFDAA